MTKKRKLSRRQKRMKLTRSPHPRRNWKQTVNRSNVATISCTGAKNAVSEITNTTRFAGSPPLGYDTVVKERQTWGGPPS